MLVGEKLAKRNPEHHGDRIIRQLVLEHGYVEYRLAPGKTLEIVTIFVEYEHQSEGIGSLMLATIEKLALELGVKGVYAFSRADNVSSHRFYMRNKYSLVPLIDFYGAGCSAMLARKVL